jgi:hypothetical protein
MAAKGARTQAECKSAWGSDADRVAKPLISVTLRGQIGRLFTSLARSSMAAPRDVEGHDLIYSDARLAEYEAVGVGSSVVSSISQSDPIIGRHKM